VKRLLIVIFAVLVAVTASASTVVLTTGKRLEVARFATQGDLVVLFYSNGRVESYPLSLLDRAATDAANAVPTAVPRPTPTGPRSPFLGAIARTGGTAPTIKDEDVRHVDEEEGNGEAKKEEETKAPAAAEVVLSGYDRARLDDGSWEITANVTNKGGLAAKNVMVSVRALDADGKSVATGSGTLDGDLAAGAQGTVKIKIEPSGGFTQLGFDLGWQEIRPGPTPSPKTAGESTPTAAVPPAAAAPQYGMAPGSSPNAVPQNPNARPPLLSSPQVVPAPPPPKAGGGSAG
jgi:hypothetical protein